MNSKKIKRAQLYKLQALQREAFDRGLNMDLHTRATGTDEPWIVGHLNVEGADICNDEEGTTYLFFHFYEPASYWTAERNQAEWDTEFDKIKAFINKI